MYSKYFTIKSNNVELYLLALGLRCETSPQCGKPPRNRLLLSVKYIWSYEVTTHSPSVRAHNRLDLQLV